MTRGPGVPGDPAASAATTLGAVVGGRAVGCDRVYLDPGTWVDLTPEGRRVVLAHEFTHLAVRRDVDGGRPAWLDEGFCEFVAYRDCPLTPAEIAADLVRDVRERGLPAALPVDEEFTSERAQLAYRAGWLACLELAAHVGDDGLARLVALASDGRLEAGLAHLLGWGLGDLTVAWRSRLARLAGVPA